MHSFKIIRHLILLLIFSLSGCTFQARLNPASPAAIAPMPETAVFTSTAPPLSSTNTPTAVPQKNDQPPHPAFPIYLANEADGTIYVIDSQSSSTAVIIPTNLHPSQIAVGEGAIWALDKPNNSVLRINPDTYALDAVISVSQGNVNSLAVGAGGVWVGVSEAPTLLVLRPYEEYDPKGGIVRIDPAQNKTGAYLPGGPVLHTAVGGGSVWALSKSTVDTPLERVDPGSLQAKLLNLAGTPDWLLEDALAASADSLWLYSASFGKLYRTSLDGRIFAEYRIAPGKPQGNADILITEKAVWLATPWGRLIRIDPHSGQQTADLDLGAPISQLAGDDNALWAASPLTASAIRVDPLTNQVAARIPLGTKINPTPYVTPTAILRASRPCENGPYSRLSLGGQVFTPAEPPLPTRLHKEAGKDSPRIGWIQPGETATILEGPTCKDNQVWWKVQTQTGGYTGWAAEGEGEDYWLIPVK